MELSSEFIQEIIDGLLPNLNVSRLCLFGYSMGGYLSGYFMLSRWKHVNEAIIIGARIKTEVFEGKLKDAKHINILALHGIDDTSVLPEPQEKEIQTLTNVGFNATFQSVNDGHKLTKPFISHASAWLKDLDY
jgi:predicted esterase